MLTYGLVKQVGPYSTNAPSSYSSTANNVTVMSPRYPYNADGESTSIHQQSLWAARLVPDSANLEDPKTSLQYAKAAQKKENITIVLGNLFGNTFQATTDTQAPQQPQGRTLGRAPVATSVFLAGLDALNYELRRQQRALGDVQGGNLAAVSEYSGPGVVTVTPQPVYGPEEAPVSPVARVLSAALENMDQQLANSIPDEALRQEMKSDVSNIWNAFQDGTDLELEFELAKLRFENMQEELQATWEESRRLQQSIMVAQSPISAAAPKTSMVEQAAQTAGIAPSKVKSKTNNFQVFDLLLNRFKTLYSTMQKKEEEDFAKYYRKEIEPNVYSQEQLALQDQAAAARMNELAALEGPPAVSPERAALQQGVPTVEDLTRLRMPGAYPKESKIPKKQSGGVSKSRYSGPLTKMRGILQKYGVWTPDQPIQYVQPGVWNPQEQPLQFSAPPRRRPRPPPINTNVPRVEGPRAPVRRVPPRADRAPPPPRINTNVRRVGAPRGQQTRISNIGKPMDSFIPQRRSGRRR